MNPAGLESTLPAPAMLADARVRERIRTDLDTTLIIEAAAGTGKTTALVSRIVAVVASGRSTLDRLVAVTFTEKAAGELKLRLRAQIESARHDPALDGASRKRLTAALPRLEEARIGTIHAFCADLLRERPVEAQIDPGFEVAPEDVTGTLFNTAFDRWFERTLAAPEEGVRRVLRRRDTGQREGPRPLLRAAAAELVEWRDFATPWRYEEFDRDVEIDRLVHEVLALGELASQGGSDDWLGKALEEIARPISEVIRLEAVRRRDYDGLEDALVGLLRGYSGRWRWRGTGPRFGALSRRDVLSRRDALKASLAQFRDRAGANLAPLLRDELWPLVLEYQELKRRAGRLDFLDLLLIARDLVRSNQIVRTELQQRFTHIFVDEFQDTDPLQAEILLLLAADDPSETNWLAVRPLPGKLFIVGDPKQSIYRFRRADVALYQTLKRRLKVLSAELEHLTVSFRAVPEIQAMVNTAFAPLMREESETAPAYAALAPFRPSNPAQPAVIVLPVPDPYNQSGYVTKRQIDESLPDAVASMVRWLVAESGWTVTEREAPEQPVPLRPRHICILFRRLNAYGRDVTRPYVRALEARHLAHVLVRGGSFNEREEVEALRNALGAIERPDDELAVFAALRGPLFALSDGALLLFRESIGSLHPFRPLPDDLSPALKPVAEALGVLRELHRGRNRRPVADTIGRLLRTTRAHAGIAIWPTGDQALANVMRLMELARRYEASGGATSMRGFVEDLEARAEREEAGEVPIVEEGTEGVRIMTVHRAKGLEFPVVILADLTCSETAREPRRVVDPEQRLCALRLAGYAPRELLDRYEEEASRDREEAARVLYVATTRARDLLIVPMVGDEPQDGWLGPLNEALYPIKENERLAQTHPAGCPAFGTDSTRTRGASHNGSPRGIIPGLHRSRAGGDYGVVWWDPALLKLDVRETMGLRQSRLLEADHNEDRSARGRLEYEDWRDRRAATITRGCALTHRVASATALAATNIDLPEATAIEMEEVARAADRPHGVRFGTLVHAALSRVSLDATRADISAVVEFNARILAAPAEEIAAAVDAVTSALASPLMLRAACAASIRRESALMVTLEDGMIVEGIADLAFLEENAATRAWTVVDFKTDREIGTRLTEYQIQLAFYVRAISRATSLPARGIILRV
ncbi:MAG: UvrD-helicase domain-containing protein [Candidatus Binataceae bacterium]